MAAKVTTLQPRRRPRQQRSRITVGFIVEAAAQVFGEQGYAGTTTNLVAERAGVSIGTLYQYFPNKDALLLELAQLHVRETADGLRQVAADLRSTRPTLPELVQRLVQTVVAHNASPVHAVVFHEAPRTPELAALLAALHDEVGRELAWHLRRLQAPVEADLAAAMLTHAVDALVHEVVLAPPEGRSREQCAQEVADLCVRYLSGGGAPAPAD